MNDLIVWEIAEEHDNCTVQILRNPQTGELSIGWWENGGKNVPSANNERE